MNKVSPLTLGLIEKRPLTAARSLASLDPGDAAAFLETLPTREAASVLSKMNAWPASALIAEMSAVNGAAVVVELDYQTAASITRVMPEAARAPLLAALPKKLSRDLNITLTYPADTVGANMSTLFIVVASDQTVADALAELRQIKRAKTGVAFIVDDSKRLLGMLNASDLLQLSNEARLNDVMDKSVAPLSARARLASVAWLPAWDDYAQLPVISRQKNLIGALARNAAQKNGIAKAPVGMDAESRSILASIANAFITSGIGLAQLIADVEERPTRVKETGMSTNPGGKS